jgi:hypothetical protein
MLEIQTARGMTILADDEDRELLSTYSWFAVKATEGTRYYAQARVPGAGVVRQRSRQPADRRVVSRQRDPFRRMV